MIVDCFMSLKLAIKCLFLYLKLCSVRLDAIEKSFLFRAFYFIKRINYFHKYGFGYVKRLNVLFFLFVFHWILICA